MSSFGSSVINKSSKKIAPKAPAQRNRPAAPGTNNAPRSSALRTALSTQDANTSQTRLESDRAKPQPNTSTDVHSERILSPPREHGAALSEVILETIEPSTTTASSNEPPRKRRRVEFAEETDQKVNALPRFDSSHLNSQGEQQRTPQSPLSHTVGSLESGEQVHAGAQSRGLRSLSNGIASPEESDRSNSQHEPQPGLDLARMRSITSPEASSLDANGTLDTSGEQSTRLGLTIPGTYNEEQTDSTTTAAGTQSEEQAAPVANMSSIGVATNSDSSIVDRLDINLEIGPNKMGRVRKTAMRKSAAPKKARKPRKKPVSDEATEEGDTETLQAKKPKRRGRKREVTPEGAEDIQIDPETMTMFELARASKRGDKGGKTSKLEQAMGNIDWEDVTNKRREKEAEDRAAGIANSRRGVNEKLDQADDTQRGPQLKLVNGQMVLDNSSLYVNRHAEAPQDEGMDELEEDDLTTRITSQSWLYDNKKDPQERFRSTHKSDPWSEAETDKFYDALSMWGTDFQIMAAMFPGKTRRHVKLKFVREEKADPDRIYKALVHDNVPMDLGAFCAATGQDEDSYKDPEALNEELRIEEEQQRADIQRQKEDVAEAQRQKQEAAAAKLGKKKSRKKKDAGPGGAGGEEVEVDIADMMDLPP